ncbi:MAG: caspase family protein [Saprospiraceae bacterium]|nr:caspase family protein [Saprospiraceae bacterium]
MRFALVLLCFTTFLQAQAPRLVIPIGHTSNVVAIAISPDGKFVLTGSYDKTAKLWTRLGQEIQTFKGHTTTVTAVAFSPAPGEYQILTGDGFGTVRLWTPDGKAIRTFDGLERGINSVAFSPDGKWILAASADSIALLWDRQSGKVHQKLIGHSSGIEQAVFSPDGKYVLTGSWNCDRIPNPDFQNVMGAEEFTIKNARGSAKLWDRETGRAIRSFEGHAESVRSVAFSPDANGKYILTGSIGDVTAILWDRDSGQKIRTFTGGCNEFVTMVGFSPDGKQVITSCDGMTIQIWDRETGERQHIDDFAMREAVSRAQFFPPQPGEPAGGKFLLLDGATPQIITLEGESVQTFEQHSEALTAVAFSPFDGGKNLLLGTDNGHSKRWDIPGGQLQTLPETEDYLDHLWQPVCAFTFAGTENAPTLLTGRTGSYWATRRDFKTGSHVEIFDLMDGSASSVAISPPTAADPAGGKFLAFGTRQNTIELWDRARKAPIRTLTKPAVVEPEDDVDPSNPFGLQQEIDFELIPEAISAVEFSPNDGGKTILSGDLNATGILWDRETGAILHTLSGHTDYVYDVAFSPDGQLLLTGSGDNTAKLWDRNGQLLRTLSGHTGAVNVVAFSPDGKSIFTASADNSLKRWDRETGKLLRTMQGHDATALAFTPDGKFIASCSQDNTSKIWDTETGQELATLVAIDSTDWVVTTPSGLFDASPGAMKMMHYVVGLEVVSLDQLKERYYEPGLLPKLLGFSKGDVRDVSSLGQVALYPEIKALLTDDQIDVQLTPRSGGMGKLSFFINGKEVVEDLNPERKTALTVDLKNYEKYYLPGTNSIAMRAYNSAGWLKSAAYELAYTPPATGRGTGSNNSGGSNSLRNDKPHLYAIVVGTSNYSGDQLDLRFPDSDAKAMAEALQASGKRLFDDRVHVKVLTTDGQTPDAISSKKNIAAAFSEYAAQAKPTDILITYFSGHGLTYGSAEKSQFYYLTKDIASPDLKDDEVRKNYTVSSEDLTQWLTANPAKKQVMILDACNSGKVVEALTSIGARELNSSQIRALDRMKDRTGMFILTGAAADKVSYEASKYNQGLLTYSLLQGMSGLALTPDKRVDVMTLFQYARDKVPDLAKGIRQVQTPVLAFPTDGGSFDIGIVDAGVKIPVAQEKPVFIRNSFQNDNDTYIDDLGLAKALNEYFQQITARSAQANLIFVDVSEYEDAYSIKGRYIVNGDAVAVRGRLFKGGTDKGKFEVSGKKDALQALVEAIVEKVAGML